MRKVLGASRRAIMTLLLGQLVRPVLLANVIAAPIAYWLLANWLVQFQDRIAITPMPFLVAAGAVVAIALLTVAALAFRAASREPGHILRHQ